MIKNGGMVYNKAEFLTYTDINMPYIKFENTQITLAETEHAYMKGNDGTLYYITDNNQPSRVFHMDPTALAVFSGKLFRNLLGEYQPDYHLFIDDKSRMRGCNWLNDFDCFQLDEDSPLHIQYKGASYSFDQIRNFTAVILAGFFLGESDWYSGNIGFVPDKNGHDLVAVRIDPGCSFHFELNIFNCSLLNYLLADPFRMIIGGINYLYDAGYFSDLFEESESDEESDELIAELQRLKYRDPALAELLNNKEEIMAVIQKIVALTRDDFFKLAIESGLTEKEANICINTLQLRQKAFEQVLLFKTLKEKGLVQDISRKDAEQEVLHTGKAILRPSSDGGIAITYLESESVSHYLIATDMKKFPSSYNSIENALLRLESMRINLSRSKNDNNNQSSTGNLAFFSQNPVSLLLLQNKKERLKRTQEVTASC